MLRAAGLHILKLRFVHAKIMPEFVKHRLAHFVANFSLIRANRLDVSLVQNDAVWSIAEVKHALMGGGHALKDPQNQAPRLGLTVFFRRSMRPSRQAWLFLDQNCKVMDSVAELEWK